MFFLLWIIALIMAVAGVWRLANRDWFGAIILIAGAFCVATGFFGILY